MNGFRIFPSEVLVHVLLSSLIGEVLLSPYDVSYTHQMIVNAGREIVKGPNTVFATYSRMRILFGVDYSQRWPVSNSRIRVVQVGLNSHHSLSLVICSIQHSIPAKEIFVRRQFPTRTSLANLRLFLKIFASTCADVSVAILENFFSVFVIDRESVALNKFGIPLATEPFQILPDYIIKLQLWFLSFRVRVFEAEIK